jgi:cobalt-zinc-cadmium efflux system membrane fusion protein
MDNKLQLSSEQLKEFGIELGRAAPGQIDLWLNLPGEVVLNADCIAHVAPKVTGVVREVHKTLGDSVQKGEIMAILESRELADSKGAYLAARQRVALAQNTFNREEQLWKKKISAEQEFINAKNASAGAQIELDTTEQKLHAIGLADSEIAAMSSIHEKNLTRYVLLAPIAGTVVEKHIDMGEVLKDDTPGFKIADLSTVWVNLSIQQKDLPFIRQGQPVILSATSDKKETTAHIAYVEPLGVEQTRTVHARVVVSNASGSWRPGLFVTARVAAEKQTVGIAISTEAIILVEGKPCVFIQRAEGFKAQPIQTGRSNESLTEVVAGLSAGQTYVRQGAFTLKSEMDKPQTE